LRVCHDLRSPIRAIRTHAELLIKKGESEALEGLRPSLGFITDGARKVDALVDALTAYSLAIATDPATFQPVRLDVLVRGALARLEAPLRETGGQVSIGELPRVQGNPDRLMQLFEEVIRNSIMHRGEAPPRIAIQGTREGDDWVIVVKDNGLGIEAGDTERVFRPFERLQGSGAGLGLASGRAIVSAHGGRMWAEAPAEGGLEVRFTLPAE